MLAATDGMLPFTRRFPSTKSLQSINASNQIACVLQAISHPPPVSEPRDSQKIFVRTFLDDFPERRVVIGFEFGAMQFKQPFRSLSIQYPDKN
jgi:hypothetical protein